MANGDDDQPASRYWMERMLRVVRRLGMSTGLPNTLTLIAEGVVEALDFEVAAVNVRTPEGNYRVEAVVGPEGLEKLLGQETTAALWKELLDAAERWGSLCHLGPGMSFEHFRSAGMPAWTPEAPPHPEPDAWLPDDVLVAPLYDPGGTLVGVLSVDLPRSGRRPDRDQLALLELFAAEAAAAIVEAMRGAELADRESVFRTVFDRAPIPMAVLDADLRLRRTNDAFLLLTRQPARRVASFAELVHPDDVDAVVQACVALSRGDVSALSLEHRLARSDSSEQWTSTRLRRAETSQGGSRLIVTLEDVTDSRTALDELRFRAEHDSLTGLPNRSAAGHHLEDLLATARPGRAVAVLFCDLDDFKQVNDLHGHAVGDDLLVRVAQRLDGVLRSADTLYRFGGDEFMILCGAIPASAICLAVGERCIEALGDPFNVQGYELSVSMSVGVACSEDATMAPRDLVESADRALYLAKAAGGRSVRLAT
jgi:diguanylate cyclase (GGDEF)-like protein/PAS domain S-box-containing protein